MFAKLVIGLFLFASATQAFELSSTDVKNGSELSQQQVFNDFGCTGKNISPALKWKNAPAGTKSFAITVYDPDAPTGSGWWHWTMFNIPVDTQELASGINQDPSKLPKGAIEGRTDYGKAGFGGACPPVGDKPHRYIVTVHALKVDKLDLTADTPAAMLGYFLNQNSLGKATITATYGRKK